jgi:hypothetical protein
VHAQERLTAAAAAAAAALDQLLCGALQGGRGCAATVVGQNVVHLQRVIPEHLLELGHSLGHLALALLCHSPPTVSAPTQAALAGVAAVERGDCQLSGAIVS